MCGNIFRPPPLSASADAVAGAPSHPARCAPMRRRRIMQCAAGLYFQSFQRTADFFLRDARTHRQAAMDAVRRASGPAVWGVPDCTRRPRFRDAQADLRENCAGISAARRTIDAGARGRLPRARTGRTTANAAARARVRHSPIATGSEHVMAASARPDAGAPNANRPREAAGCVGRGAWTISGRRLPAARRRRPDRADR